MLNRDQENNHLTIVRSSRLTILAGGDGAVLALGVNLGECEEHHGPGVAAAGERGLSEAAHGHRRSLEVTGGRGRDDRAWETDTGHARTELQPGTTGPDWLDTDRTLQSPHFQNRGHHSHNLGVIVNSRFLSF